MAKKHITINQTQKTHNFFFFFGKRIEIFKRNPLVLKPKSKECTELIENGSPLLNDIKNIKFGTLNNKNIFNKSMAFHKCFKDK